ncbi:hypothetical protein C7M84_003098 [Penaeus vannamei]|uniref:Uncharacterized protein n=1 Tax=Penaeus vannamei TaxID=6689 RepID=A0A3R7SW72_PENVA|nr:hypothetical protein C7M84_003098 [Penaeus vannamei]
MPSPTSTHTRSPHIHLTLSSPHIPLTLRSPHYPLTHRSPHIHSHIAPTTILTFAFSHPLTLALLTSTHTRSPTSTHTRSLTSTHTPLPHIPLTHTSKTQPPGRRTRGGARPRQPEGGPQRKRLKERPHTSLLPPPLLDLNPLALLKSTHTRSPHIHSHSLLLTSSPSLAPTSTPLTLALLTSTPHSPLFLTHPLTLAPTPHPLALLTSTHTPLSSHHRSPHTTTLALLTSTHTRSPQHPLASSTSTHTRIHSCCYPLVYTPLRAIQSPCPRLRLSTRRFSTRAIHSSPPVVSHFFSSHSHTPSSQPLILVPASSARLSQHSLTRHTFGVWVMVVAGGCEEPHSLGPFEKLREKPTTHLNRPPLHPNRPLPHPCCLCFHPYCTYLPSTQFLNYPSADSQKHTLHSQSLPWRYTDRTGLFITLTAIDTLDCSYTSLSSAHPVNLRELRGEFGDTPKTRGTLRRRGRYTRVGPTGHVPTTSQKRPAQAPRRPMLPSLSVTFSTLHLTPIPLLPSSASGVQRGSSSPGLKHASSITREEEGGAASQNAGAVES